MKKKKKEVDKKYGLCRIYIENIIKILDDKVNLLTSEHIITEIGMKKIYFDIPDIINENTLWDNIYLKIYNEMEDDKSYCINDYDGWYWVELTEFDCKKPTTLKEELYLKSLNGLLMTKNN